MNLLKKCLKFSLIAISLSATLFLGIAASASNLYTTGADENNSSQFNVNIPKLTNENIKTNIIVNSDGSFTVGESNQVPQIYEGATKFGMITSDMIESPNNFQSVVVKVDKIQVNENDIVFVDVRTSKDGVKWGEWLIAKEEKANEINFYDTLKFLQYRVRIISVENNNYPIIKNISLKLKRVTPEETKDFNMKKPINVTSTDKFKKPTNVLSSELENSMQPELASFIPYTVSCYATMEGLVGKITYNGHKIVDSDVFVALPAPFVVNSSDKDTTYTVNVTYNGNTIYNVPVWDVGPYNELDDYWNNNYFITSSGTKIPVRQTSGYDGYGDIARGTSEEYAAYNFGFHNGWTSYHRIGGNVNYYVSNSNPGTQVHNSLSNPNYPSNTLRNNGADIDLSNGLYDKLGITRNTNHFVSVTFNWVSQ